VAVLQRHLEFKCAGPLFTVQRNNMTAQKVKEAGFVLVEKFCVQPRLAFPAPSCFASVLGPKVDVLRRPNQWGAP
jgi:hypothetical protein